MSNHTSARPRLLPWLLGVLLATGFALVIAQFWVSSALWYEYDEGFEKWFPRQGSYRYLKEGWGLSQIGKYGINGIVDVTQESRPKFLIWGDSFVEAYHVPDEDKMAQQATAMLRAEYGVDALGVAFGFTGHSLADYVLDLPKLEARVQPILLHVVVIDDLRDTFPADVVSGDFAFAQFLSKPTYHIAASSWTPPYNGVERFWDRSRLYGAKAVVGNLLFQLRGLRFRPGPVAAQAASAEPTVPENPGESWDYILARLRAATDKPILVIYLPKVPYLNDGQVVVEDDSHAGLLPQFVRMCNRHRMDVVNMEDAFVDFFRQTRAFPRGFPNTVPDRGHLNAAGHRLVAAAIAAFLGAESRESGAFLQN